VGALNSFDRIAPVYDRLADIVFGTAILDAQRTHLHALNDAREILILGGGTGGLLRDLLGQNATSRVTYVEASQRMIERARKNVPDADRRRVVFVHGTQDILTEEPSFDAVIVNFFVDIFPSAELVGILRRLRAVLLPGGQLLCTDFVDDTRWQKTLLPIMYAFFRITADLQNQRLAPWRKLILDVGFEKQCSAAFWNGFICSELYRKNATS
jgi:tRNA (cmo5U34)-methyltransferase